MFKCSGVQYRWTCVQYRSSGVLMYRYSDWHVYLVLLQQLLHEESSTACTMSPTTSSLSPPPHLHLLHGAVLEPPELAAVAPELTGTPDMPPPPQTPGPGCWAASTGRPLGPPARPHTSSYSQNPTLDKRPPRPLALLATSRLAGAAPLSVTSTTLL